LPTALLCPGLQRLLDVRRAVGLRNPAHSLVKIMNPCLGKSLVLSSYTHPEYAVAMAATFELTLANAILLRGTEGESVADPRRMPKMDGFLHGRHILLQQAQSGALSTLPDLPAAIDAVTTARYIRAVLDGSFPTPAPIRQQVAHVLNMVNQL
jgi:anthranilate phosphoribosyltransferase